MRKTYRNLGAWILNVDMTLSLTVTILNSYLSYLTYQRATISSIFVYMKHKFYRYQNDIQRKTQYSPFNETHLLITYKPNEITNGTTSAIFNLKDIMSNMLYVCMYSRHSPHIVSHCALKKWQSTILFSERISGILCYYIFTKIHQIIHFYRG